MKKNIDLHIHSTASDGTLTPTELVNLAKERNLKAIALTDHDTISGLQDAINEGNKIGVEVVPGIEISASYKNLELHILGLYVNYKNRELIEFTKKLRNERKIRNHKVIKKLNELGFNITIDEAKKYAIGDIIAKGHIIRVMIDKGYVRDGQEAREKYFYEGGAAYFKKAVVTPREAINIIENAGGVPILAHPGEFRISKEDIKKIILEIKNEGIKGIESYYYSYTKEMKDFLENIAFKNNLLVSGGSDFHGHLQPQTGIGVGKGNLKIPYKVLEKIKQYLENKK